MKVHEAEVKIWNQARPNLNIMCLTTSQLADLNESARRLLEQSLAHPAIHDFFGAFLVLTLLSLDVFAFSLKGLIGVATMCLGHGFMLYSLTIYTMHEGAGHKRIIIGRSRLSKMIAFFVNNTSRLFFADPLQYSQVHPSHHRFLGTHLDQAFTHSVLPIRIFKSFLPGAGFLSFNDYKIHSGDQWTVSKLLSMIVGLTYHGLLILVASRQHHVLVASVSALIIAPWIGFSLDRLRESTEHLLMKSDDLPEARELGTGPWGYFIGGGPWGQPCHLSHHLAPALPWYQQLRLSRHLVKILTPEQRLHYFAPRGFLGFPKMFARLMKENRNFFREFA
jgi:fatty acid desaturase